MSLALLFQPPSGRAGVVQPASGLNMKKKYYTDVLRFSKALKETITII